MWKGGGRQREFPLDPDPEREEASMARRLSDRVVALWVRWQVQLRGWVADVRGLQTLEWVALAIVILAFLGAVATVLSRSGEGTVAQAVANAIKHFFEQLTR